MLCRYATTAWRNALTANGKIQSWRIRLLRRPTARPSGNIGIRREYESTSETNRHGDHINIAARNDIDLFRQLNDTLIAKRHNGIRRNELLQPKVEKINIEEKRPSIPVNFSIWWNRHPKWLWLPRVRRHNLHLFLFLFYSYGGIIRRINFNFSMWSSIDFPNEVICETYGWIKWKSFDFPMQNFRETKMSKMETGVVTKLRHTLIISIYLLLSHTIVGFHQQQTHNVAKRMDIETCVGTWRIGLGRLYVLCKTK